MELNSGGVAAWVCEAMEFEFLTVGSSLKLHTFPCLGCQFLVCGRLLVARGVDLGSSVATQVINCGLGGLRSGIYVLNALSPEVGFGKIGLKAFGIATGVT